VSLQSNCLPVVNSQAIFIVLRQFKRVLTPSLTAS
jgi:hypothetical protein